MDETDAARRAANLIQQADGLIVTAGAGMGVDSGLPDFRGDQGFWKAYPPYERLGLPFMALANPQWFQTDPAIAWGFYGHRRNLYRATTPHPGFALLRQWMEERPSGGFVFTSNVDHQFPRAGFPGARIVEVHGSIEWLQCTEASCSSGIWPAGPEEVAIDLETMRAAGPLPTCAACGKRARPNILMFGDHGWQAARTDEQHGQLRAWLEGLRRGRLVVVECGAGTAVPTIRRFGERLLQAGVPLVRINPREPEVPEGGISLAVGALTGLRAIAAAG